MSKRSPELRQAVERVLQDYLRGVALRCPDCKMGLPCSHAQTFYAALRLAAAEGAADNCPCHAIDRTKPHWRCIHEAELAAARAACEAL